MIATGRGRGVTKFGVSSDLVSCTFCGKSHKQVDKLITGPGVYICNDCIHLCNEIIDDEGITSPEAAWLPPLSADQLVRRAT